MPELISRNPAVRSCAEAAHHRYRLGNRGIPLWDELKSLLVTNEKDFAMLHTRAHRQFDIELAKQALAWQQLEKVDAETLQNKLGMIYGTVNPQSCPPQYQQVFDSCIFARYTPPHTMMTNNNNLTVAIEFHPQELFEQLKAQGMKAQKACISQGGAEDLQLPVFGILTGNSPESGMLLWRLVNQFVYSLLEAKNLYAGDLSYPQVIINSNPLMGMTMEIGKRKGNCTKMIKESIARMKAAGISHLAIACHTSHALSQEILAECLQAKIAFVSLKDLVLEEAAKLASHKTCLMGIGDVASLAAGTTYHQAQQMGIKPLTEKALSDISDLAFLIKQESLRGVSKALNRFRHIIRSHIKEENILLVLTELSELYSMHPKVFKPDSLFEGKKLIEPLSLFAKRLAEIYLGRLPQVSKEEE